tara:strand:- start:3093 stop:4529 length:1437 start_codon:yes stop_codon:yes gene_type:complete
MPNFHNSAAIIEASDINFGTSGARGLVTQFTDQACAAFTAAFIAVMQRDFVFDRVALAIDLRPSSPTMAAACATAIQNAGLAVDYYGVIPTPALAYQAMQDGIPAIMVTGSHIPFDRNGLKFYRPDGEIEKSDEQAILAADVAFNWGAPGPLPAASVTATNSYLKRYQDFFPADMLAGKKLGLYEHSSAGRDLYRLILEEFGAEVVSLGRTDQFVPIDTEAVSDADRARGRDWSQSYGFDAIISTDGDADRPLIADEKGDWLRGDIVGLLCARYLGINALAVPVSCNSAIDLCGDFATVLRTRIGSPYVIEGMQQLAQPGQSVAGFEANGGFLLGSTVRLGDGELAPLPTRDALLPALALLAASSVATGKLSELSLGLPQRFTASDRLTEFPTTRSHELLNRWAADPSELLSLLQLPSQFVAAINTTDGLRLTLEDQRIVHLRPSGNAPELRCYCEADDPNVAQMLVQRTLQQVKMQI